MSIYRTPTEINSMYQNVCKSLHNSKDTDALSRGLKELLRIVWKTEKGERSGTIIMDGIRSDGEQEPKFGNYVHYDLFESALEMGTVASGDVGALMNVHPCRELEVAVREDLSNFPMEMIAAFKSQ